MRAASTFPDAERHQSKGCEKSSMRVRPSFMQALTGILLARFSQSEGWL